MQENNSELENDKINDLHQFEALFNYATIGIVVTNENGEIINFNRFAETQFGYTKAEVLGKKVEILLPRETHQKHQQHRNQYIQHPEPRVMGNGRDLFAKTKDNKVFPVEVSLSYFTVNKQTFVFAFVIDISIRKNHEAMVLQQQQELEKISKEIKKMNSHLEQKVEERTEMLREALSELERSKEELKDALENEKELSELKSRFVTMASHEFRTPLSTILSSSFLLEKYNQQAPNEKVEKHLHRIKGAVAGMKSILEDFLSLGKLEEGLVQIHNEKISENQFLHELKELVQEMETIKKPNQIIQLKYTVDRVLEIDKNLIRNILLNLLSNAIKFTGENSTIDLIVSLKEKQLQISVADKGIGISEEDQQHLFGRFFRAKNAANIQGTGLGLHIVAKYLELLQGKIELKSKIDEGSTFTIYIPQQ